MVKYHHQTYGKTDDPEFNDDDALFGLGQKKTTKPLVSQTSAKTIVVKKSTDEWGDSIDPVPTKNTLRQPGTDKNSLYN